MSDTPSLSYRVREQEQGLRSLTEVVSKLTTVISEQSSEYQLRMSQMESNNASLSEKMGSLVAVVGRQGRVFQRSVEQMARDNRSMLDQHIQDNKRRDDDIYNRVSAYGRADWRMIAAWAGVVLLVVGGAFSYVQTVTEPLRVYQANNAARIESLDADQKDLTSQLTRCESATCSQAMQLSMLEKMVDSCEVRHNTAMRDIQGIVGKLPQTTGCPLP
ncbi:MAG: hypothetical protein WCX88_03220 [Patescibacteria group bacterium]